jgi:glycosyltransferase involved in cell wall biosynthesis
MVRKEVWLELGGFDEKYSPAYYEEVDFCARALTAGYQIVYLPDVVIDHFEFASTSGVSEASQMQITRRNIFIESQRDFLKSQQDVEKHALTQARSRSLKPKILIIDDQIPRVSAGQGFARIVRLVETLQNTGFTVTVAATAHVGSVQWPEIWQELGPDIECIPDLSPRTLEAFLSEREGSYQLLWVSRPHNLSYLREIQARRPKLLNTPIIYDAEALTTANRVSTDGQEISITELQENAQDETSLTDIAQAVVCVSPLDRSAFSALTNKPTFIATHSLPIRPTNNDFESRRGVLFFGALTNLKSPNVESLKWFINEVWPKLPAQFRSKNPLQIAGQILPSLAKEWAREDIKVLGLVPNLWELANQAKLFVAPTRRAQGVPIKVLEAASFGLPSVVTPVLAQQLQWTAQKQALVAHDPSDFAKAITYLSTDETTWSAIRTSALTSAAQFCDPQSFDQAVLDAINAVGVQLPRRQ